MCESNNHIQIILYIVILIVVLSPVSIFISSCSYGSTDESVIDPISLASETEVTRNAGAYASWEYDDENIGLYRSEDGQILSPDKLFVPAYSIRTVEMRINTSENSVMTIYWRNSDNDFDDIRSTTIELVGDDAPHDYQINLSNHNEWNGVIDQLKFSSVTSSDIEINFVRLTGLYFAPYPWLSYSDVAHDALVLWDIKNTFKSQDNHYLLGFAGTIDYLTSTDENGNLLSNRPEHLLKLAKIADMPVAIRFRADPWAYANDGVFKTLYEDDANKMWTSDGMPYASNDMGQRYLCLAMTDINGNETAYWKYTDMVLKQVSERVNALIQEAPEYILAVTTNEEYSYRTTNGSILDYNIRTINEFREYCEEKYSSIESFNAEFGTKFTTWQLKHPVNGISVVTDINGFDPPRDLNSSKNFWDIWTIFRANQIKKALSRQVSVIGSIIDGKYIYTKQVNQEGHLMASPMDTGNIAGTNIGIDLLARESNEENFKLINSMIGSDVSRTWGNPEWLANDLMSGQSGSNDHNSILKSLELMHEYGIKLLTPFNWGSNDVNDIRGRESESALLSFFEELTERSLDQIEKDVH